jgi:excisionase family DNA binding protein
MEAQGRPLLSKHDAKRLLCVSLGTINNLIRDQKLPVVRIGARVLIDPADLSAFVESMKATARAA